MYKHISFSIEENKKAEKALQESEERYRHLFETAPNAIFVHNEEHFIFVNPPTVRLAGARNADDLIGKPVLDFILPENKEYIMAEMRYVLETHKPSRVIETKIIRMDGLLIDIAIIATFIIYEGKPAIQTIAYDITKRKKAEEDLKESEEKYRTLVERANDGITILQDGIVKYSNPRHAEIMGYTVEELTNTRFTEYIHPDQLPKVLDFYNRRIAGESVPEVYETVVKNKDGSDINVEFNAGLITYQGKSADLVFVRDITERKRMENKLLESEKRFRDMFENSPVAILESDLSGIKTYIDTLIKNEHIDDINAYLVQHPDALLMCRGMIKVLDVNQPALELFEAGSKSEFIENIDKMFVKESYETFSQEIIAIMNGEKQVVLDTLLRTLSGEIRDAMVQCAVSPGHEDTLSRIQVSFVDITERKRVEKELQKSEERFRNLFENIPVAVMEEDFSAVRNYMDALIKNEHIDDLEAYMLQHPAVVSMCAGLMKIVDVNQAAIELHEAGSKGEFLENIEKTFTNESYVTFCKELVAILSGETQMETEGTVQTLSGMPLEIAIQWSVPPGYEKTLSRVLVSIIDITDRKKAEEELRNAHQKLLDIIEFLPDGAFVIDNEKKVISWNRAIEEMTGVKKEEILGKGDYAYAMPFYKERRPLLIDLVFVTDSEIEKKYDFVKKKGDYIYAEAFLPYTYGGKGAYIAGVAAPLYDGNGIRIGAIESIHDITEQKHAENDLKNYAEKLVRSNELKDLFTDILHHDLLNPAGVIKGHTEILLDMEDDKKKRNSLRAIERNNEKLVSIIEKASTFAKLESIDKIEFETLDIGTIIEGVIENFRHSIEEKQMVLEFAAKSIYPSKVNPVIEEVFANLLSNAIKYSPEGGKIIVDILDSGNEWKVTVTDFGGGITDEEKTGLFERFRRADRGGVKGTGLGLAIVKRLIALHFGSVGVEDNPEGKGSVFWVTLKKA